MFFCIIEQKNACQELLHCQKEFQFNGNGLFMNPKQTALAHIHKIRTNFKMKTKLTDGLRI